VRIWNRSSDRAHLESFERGFGFAQVGFNEKVKTEVELGFSLGIVYARVPPKRIRSSPIVHVGEGFQSFNKLVTVANQATAIPHAGLPSSTVRIGQGL